MPSRENQAQIKDDPGGAGVSRALRHSSLGAATFQRISPVRPRGPGPQRSAHSTEALGSVHQ